MAGVVRADGEGGRYTICRVGRLAFLRWWVAPHFGDLVAIIAWLAEQKRQAEAELVVVEVVTAGIPRPSADVVRKAIGEVKGLRYVRRRHVVVIEGDSFERAIVRGVFATLTFVLGETLQTAPSVDEAIARSCAEIGQDAGETMRLLEEAGVLHAPMRE